MPRTKQSHQPPDHVATRSIETILPIELWDRVMRCYQDECDQDKHYEMFQILCVSKSWAKVCLPVLYHEIRLEIFVDPEFNDEDRQELRGEEMKRLASLASLMAETPPTHPRRTWMRIFSIGTGFTYESDKQQLDEVYIISRYLIPIFRAQTNLTEFALTSSDDQGFPMHTDAMKVLSELHKDTMTSLDINSSSENIPGLFRLVSGIDHLSKLTLTFSPRLVYTAKALSGRYRRFDGVPPLHMPNVREFRWNWRDRDTRRSALDLKYLASCRFHPNCSLYLEFDHDYVGLSAQEADILDPVFVHHRDNRIELCRISVSDASSVLAQAKEMTFQVGLPPAALFEADNLPAVVVLFLLYVEEAVRLWPILDVLLLSERERSMHIQIDVKGLSKNHPDYGGAGHIMWERPPQEVVDEDIMIITYRLMQYARELREKGIIIFDSAGVAFDYEGEDDFRDAMYEEKWMYLY